MLVHSGLCLRLMHLLFAGSFASSPSSAWGSWNLPSDGSDRTHSSFCEAVKAGSNGIAWLDEPNRLRWEKTRCLQLPLWAKWRGGRARVFHHPCNLAEDPTAVDAVIGQALRWTFEYFLGRPEWALRKTCDPTAPDNLEEADTSSAALVVGGGRRFGSPDWPAAANRSGPSSSRWLLNQTQMLAIEAAPLLLFGVSCADFIGEPGSSGKGRPSRASMHNHFGFRVLAHPTSIIGIREPEAAMKLRRSVMDVNRRNRVRHQPCPTTLLGLLRPEFTSDALRDSAKRVLSLDVSFHPGLTKLGDSVQVVHIMSALADWCTRAYRTGWTIHLTTTEPWLVIQQARATSPFLDYLSHLPKQPFTYEVFQFPSAAKTGEDLLEYYRTRVTVAASTRVHGIMIPFGLQVAVIALVADSELDSFARHGLNGTLGVVRLDSLWRNKNEAGNSTFADRLWGALCSIDQDRGKVLRHIQTVQGTLMRSTANTMAQLRSTIWDKLTTLQVRRELKEQQPNSSRLEAFLNLHMGKTIYVVGSGSTAGYIAPNYFDGELTIGVNQVCNRFSNLTYLLRKDAFSTASFREVLKQCGPSTRHFVSRGARGFINNDNGKYVLAHHRQATNIIVYEHSICSSMYGDRMFHELPPLPDATHIPRLVTTSSTITTAIHLAAIMGAARIILVGHDLFSLDDQDNFPGYHTAATLRTHGHRNETHNRRRYRRWLTRDVVSLDSIHLRSLLKLRYPHLHINSLSPFIGLGLEGHHVERVPSTAVRRTAKSRW